MSIKENIISEQRVYQMYINGEFISNKETSAVINPSDKQIISYIPKGTVEDAKRAIDSAYEAQDSWGKLPAIERGNYLKKIPQKIRENGYMLAKTITEELKQSAHLKDTRFGFVHIDGTKFGAVVHFEHSINRGTAFFEKCWEKNFSTRIY